MKSPQIPLAREGYPFIAFSGFSSLVTAVLGYDLIALALLFLTGFIVYFFRDPERVCSAENDVLVAPADGKIIQVEKVFDDRYVKEHVLKVSIFMNVFNVHVNRSPFPGKVVRIEYSPGAFYSANTERGGLENEMCAMILESFSGKKMAVVQVAGLIARRIVCLAEQGDSLARGQRYGLIRFGSRVDLFLPLQVQLEVSVGQKVKGGETILGYLS